jgi:hypothetical protein
MTVCSERADGLKFLLPTDSLSILAIYGFTPSALVLNYTNWQRAEDLITVRAA